MGVEADEDIFHLSEFGWKVFLLCMICMVVFFVMGVARQHCIIMVFISSLYITPRAHSFLLSSLSILRHGKVNVESELLPSEMDVMFGVMIMFLRSDASVLENASIQQLGMKWLSERKTTDVVDFRWMLWI